MFEELEGYLGSALQLVRMSALRSRGRVLGDLNSHMGRNISLTLFDEMEQNRTNIEPDIFDSWCKILPGGQNHVLTMARNLQQKADKSDENRLQEKTDELDYHGWNDN